MAWGRRAQGSSHGLEHTMQLTASYECKTYDNASGWCLYFAQGCVILSPSVVACPLHVNLGSRDERMASILSKNIDTTNILYRVGICGEVSVRAILQRYAT